MRQITRREFIKGFSLFLAGVSVGAAVNFDDCINVDELKTDSKVMDLDYPKQDEEYSIVDYLTQLNRYVTEYHNNIPSNEWYVIMSPQLWEEFGGTLKELQLVVR